MARPRAGPAQRRDLLRPPRPLVRGTARPRVGRNPVDPGLAVHPPIRAGEFGRSADGLDPVSRRFSTLQHKRHVVTRALMSILLVGTVFAAVTSIIETGPASAAQPGPTAASPGYWLGASDGGIFTYGDVPFQGSLGARPLNRPIVGMAATPTGRGYWLVASDGGIFTFGDAVFSGSGSSLRLTSPVVGMAATPSGKGYWVVSADGGVYAFGDAPDRGSMSGKRLTRPVVGMAATPTGQGYWLVATDGGIFSFGDAQFFGSQGNKPLNRPIVGMASTPSGHGYWMVASDGGIFTFGDAPFAGSTGAMRLNRPIVGMATTPTGHGYWLVATDGGIFTFGDAAFFGSAGSLPLTAPVVGMAAAPARHRAEVAAFYYPWWGNPNIDGTWAHWQNARNQPPDDITSDFYPARAFYGPYSSGDPNTLDEQFAEIANAGIDLVVVSWWGKNSYEDTHLQGVKEAAAAHGVRVAIHLEPYDGRLPSTVESDIAY